MSTPSGSLIRIPCKICGVEILLATAERNEGLCGRCAKGARPCIYCGEHVYESLSNGEYAHVECSIRNRQEKENLGWRSVEDIDWQKTKQLLHRIVRRLFENLVPSRSDTNPATLVFYIHVEDFIDIIVYESSSDGSSKRLSSFDSEWEADLSPLDSSFSILLGSLNAQEVTVAVERVRQSLKSILTEECSALEKENFCFPKSVPVTWRIKTS